MFGENFYNGTLRKYVIYFGTLFNNIEIDRVDGDGATIQTIPVPIAYGPKEKYIALIEQNPNLDAKIAISLPRMSFEMTSIQYSPERRLNPTTRMYNTISANNTSELRSVYTPTPFDISFQLAIYVRNAEDGVRILEQILPYFTPEYTATLKLLDNMPDIKMDIPVVFNSMATEDTYEGDFVTRRVLIHTIEFTLKGYVFGPVRERGGIIKLANTQFFVEDSGPEFTLDSDVKSKVTIRPGLNSNGEPINTYGITANAISSITNGIVSEINLLVRGRGYSNATVTIPAPNSITAQATPSIAGGLINAFDIDTGGGYYPVAPTFTITGFRDNEGTPEAFSETVSSTITSGIVTGISLPTTNSIINAVATASPPPNVAANAVATVANGKISNIVLVSGGAGYLTAPTITVSTPDNISIDRSLIEANSNYGYVTEKNFYE